MAEPVLKNPKVKAEIKKIKDEHSVKTKALMKSIDKLKTDLEKEKYQNQDSVRAKIIERMKKDIADNETVIEMMRAMIDDDDQINKEIVKVLSKGPLRARVLSREELRMEIKRLNNLLNAKKSKKSSKTVVMPTEESNKDQEPVIEMVEKAELLEAQQKIEEAERKYEDLKDDMKARDMNLRMMTEKVNDMNEEITLFKRVKDKLKDLSKKGMFRKIELDEHEEDDDETINSLHKLQKLIEQYENKANLTESDYLNEKARLQQAKADKEDEVNGLIDEYNAKDDELQSINDRYIAAKRECKKYMYELAKCKEEMEEAQQLAKDLKIEYKEKLQNMVQSKDETVNPKIEKIKELEARNAELEEKLIEKENHNEVLKEEIERLLQNTPGSRSDDSTQMDPYALYNERKKVQKLTEEIKRLYDIIDKLKEESKILKLQLKEETLKKARNASRERK